MACLSQTAVQVNGYSREEQEHHGYIQRACKADLEAKHSVIKLVPEGGEVIEEGGLLHGVPLNHAVHEPQGTQHDIALQPTAHFAGPHDMAALPSCYSQIKAAETLMSMAMGLGEI